MSWTATNVHICGPYRRDKPCYIRHFRTSGAPKCAAVLGLPYLLPHLPPRLPRLLDRTLIFDGGDVARIAVEDHGPQHAAHDLSASRLRQHRHEVELADDGHRPE